MAQTVHTTTTTIGSRLQGNRRNRRVLFKKRVRLFSLWAFTNKGANHYSLVISTQKEDRPNSPMKIASSNSQSEPPSYTVDTTNGGSSSNRLLAF